MTRYAKTIRSRRRLSLIVRLALSLAAGASLCLAQSSEPSPSSPPAKPSSSTETPAPAPTALADPSSKTSASAKPKHVYTNEDFELHNSPRSADSPEVNATPAENSNYLICDTSCEREAHHDFVFGADSEVKWQVQIVKARDDLATDSRWRDMLFRAHQDTDTYCIIRLQQSQVTFARRGDYEASVQSLKAYEYFRDMNKQMSMAVEGDSNRIEQHIAEARELSPVLASLMTEQSARVLNRPCKLPGPK